MEKLLDPATWNAWANEAQAWLIDNALDGQTLAQLALGLALLGVAILLARVVRKPLTLGLARLRIPRHLHRLREHLPRVLSVMLYLPLLWLAIGVMSRVWSPEWVGLLEVLASLLSAWIVIRLGSTLINNRLAARALVVVAWSLAALNITGLLGPLVQVLDALAIDFGNLRISLLTVIKAMATMALLLWSATILSGFLERRVRTVQELTPSVQVLIGKLLKVTLLSLAVILALTSVGIDLSALALFSGAIGVGLGFGLQKVVSNLISGVIILLDKSIKPGDTIELGETFGWITSLGARYVSVVTRDGKEYLIPNEDFITQRVVNWSFSNELVRLEIPIGVSYDSDPHEVRRIVVEAATKPERVSKSPKPVCHLVGFGDSSLDFLLRFWIKDPRDGVVNIKGQVLLAVWDTFKEHGIDIPFPHRQLLVDQPIRIRTDPVVENAQPVQARPSEGG